MKIVDFMIVLSKGNAANTNTYQAAALTLTRGSCESSEMRFAGSGLLGEIPLLAIFDSARATKPADPAFFKAMRALSADLPDAEDKESVRIVGEGLYEALPLRVRDLYNQTWGWVMDDPTRMLRVRIRFDNAPELAALPWEYMKCGKGTDEEFLCENPQRSLIRVPDGGGLQRQISIPDKPKLVIWGTQPTEMAQVAFEKEVGKVMTEFQNHFADQVEIVVFRSGGFKALRNLLQDATILHYIGHAGFIAGEGKLALVPKAGVDGGLQLVNATRLKALLGNNQSLQLVFLNACRTATSGMTGIYTSLAFQMARFVPAVIGMQYSIQDDIAIAFSTLFYSAFVQGKKLDECVAEGRQGVIFDHDVQMPYWGTPVVCTRTPLDMS